MYAPTISLLLPSFLHTSFFLFRCLKHLGNHLFNSAILYNKVYSQFYRQVNEIILVFLLKESWSCHESMPLGTNGIKIHHRTAEVFASSPATTILYGHLAFALPHFIMSALARAYMFIFTKILIYILYPLVSTSLIVNSIRLCLK